MKTTTIITILAAILIGMTIACDSPPTENPFQPKDDWANLARFKTANAQLQSPTPDEQRVVFMGNSITECWLPDSLAFFTNKAYINRGISGQTTPQMLIRFRPDVVELEPSLVVILAGINDIAGNTGPTTINAIANNLKSMVEIAKANDIKVLLCSVLPANAFPWNPKVKPAQKVIELNTILKDFAIKNDVAYLDYFEKMVDDNDGLKAELTYDGVHPNEAGYMMMKELAEEAIEKVLGE